MVRSLPAVRTVLDPAALGRRVARDYDLGPVRGCRFHQLGLNDTYELRAGPDRYALRLYRRGWRTADDVAYEIDALEHLAARGVPVAAPVRRNDGGFVGELRAPEGPRPFVLFRWVAGREPAATPEASRRYGAAAAAIHAATDDLASPHARFALDAAYLVEAAFRALRPFLAHRPDDAAFLDDLVDRLRAALAAPAVAALDHGFCHGDLHGGNAHADDAGVLRFFDLDCCGPGPRAYDLAVFRWRQAWRGAGAAANWPAFLDGYRSVRPLPAADEGATDLFVAVRELWLIGLHAVTSPDRGHAYSVANEDYLDARLRFLRGWTAEHAAAAG